MRISKKKLRKKDEKKIRENDDKIPVECLELVASSRHIATEFWPFQPTLHQPALTEKKQKKKIVGNTGNMTKKNSAYFS